MEPFSSHLKFQFHLHKDTFNIQMIVFLSLNSNYTFFKNSFTLSVPVDAGVLCER